MKMSRFSMLEEMNFREEVLSQFARIGGVGQETGRIIQIRNIHLKFRKQKHSAAAWTLSGNIHINIEQYSDKNQTDNPFLLSLIVHETRHLQQGVLTALSVYGELDAWQVGFRFYKEISSSPLDPLIEKILLIPLDWSRGNLTEAASFMK